MIGLFRLIITLGVLAALVTCGATIPLGQRTFFEHVGRIWAADETQEMVEGVKESSGPYVEKIRRGVNAGVKAAKAEQPDAGAAADPSPNP